MTWKLRTWEKSVLPTDYDAQARWWSLKTPIGEVVVEPSREGWAVFYFAPSASDEVRIGTRKSERTAKRFAESYIRNLANRALEMLG